MLGRASTTGAGTAIALALVLLVPPGVASLETEPAVSPIPEADPTEASVPDLVEPLVHLASSHEERAMVEAAHAQGQAWASDQLEDPTELSRAVERLYASLDVDAEPSAASVPAAFEVPLAALVTLQAVHTADAGPYAELATDEAQAFTLGALEPIVEDLEDARHEAPEEPIFVDPLGLVVLGGSGDNAYEPRTLGPTEWSGAHLVVEPAGNDIYNVPVAAPTSVASDGAPDIRYQMETFALEFGGHDAYNEQTASADLASAFLIDRRGHDRYADTDVQKTTAHASADLAYLLDEQGNDIYRTHSRGLAYAKRASTAILWDSQGNDTYRGNPGGSHDTHAMANSREATAYLWDERGNDTYRAGVSAYGASFNDAIARFVDEDGNDDYSVFSHTLSFGIHYETASPFVGDSILQRGLGEFIDGNGNDTYDWEDSVGGMPPENNNTHVDHRDDRKWGIFIDCETPDDAHRPCPEEQHRAYCTVAHHPATLPSAPDPVGPILAPPLDQTEAACQAAYP